MKTLSRVVRKTAMPVQFDDRTIDYIVKGAMKGDKVLSGKTNPKTWQLMKEGYVVLRNFIPKDIITMTMDAWKSMELNPVYHDPDALYREQDIIHNSPKDSLNKSTGMYCSPFGIALHRWTWEKLKHHIDMDLQETYSYSRKYERGAYLKAHADRPSCEISATLCLGYETDDNTPWSIWVDNTLDYINRPSEIFEDTQALPIRQRKTARKIDLEVGDILLYQGPNVAHWREYLLGNHSYHIFLHFLNRNGKVTSMPHVREIVEETISEETMQCNQDYNPCKFDGRLTRWHPIDENSDVRKAFQKFSDVCWNNNEMWMQINKSDYVNDFKDFIQVVDGKEVTDKQNFKYKYKEYEENATQVGHKV